MKSKNLDKKPDMERKNNKNIFCWLHILQSLEV